MAYVVKLLDYQSKKEELRKTDNPFAIIILAQLAVLESKKNPYLRLHLKVELVRALYGKNWARGKILNLYHLLDWIMVLPENLAIQCNQLIKSIEEEHQMTYITSMERAGIQQGFRQGIQEGLQKGRQEGQMATFVTLLQLCFGEIPKNYQTLIAQGDEQKIKYWLARVLTAKTLKEVFEEE